MNTKFLFCVMAVFLIGSGTPTPTAEVTVSFDWAYRAGDYVRGTPAVSGQVVYVGSDDNNLHAVSTETGEGVWKFGTAGNVTSQPVIAGDAIYFGSWDGAVHAAAGQPRAKPSGRYVTGGWITASPVLANDVLYIGSNDGNPLRARRRRRAFDLALPDRRPDRLGGQSSTATASSSGRATAISMRSTARSGTLLWRYRTGGPSWARPPPPAEPCSRVKRPPASTRSIAATGDLKWRFQGGGRLRVDAQRSPTAWSYVGGNDGRLVTRCGRRTARCSGSSRPRT